MVYRTTTSRKKPKSQSCARRKCGIMFTPRNKWHKFCSPKCRWQDWFDRTYVKRK